MRKGKPLDRSMHCSLHSHRGCHLAVCLALRPRIFSISIVVGRHWMLIYALRYQAITWTSAAQDFSRHSVKQGQRNLLGAFRHAASEYTAKFKSILRAVRFSLQYSTFVWFWWISFKLWCNRISGWALRYLFIRHHPSIKTKQITWKGRQDVATP